MTKLDPLKERKKPRSFWGFVRDTAYDSVFHVGDTAQTVLWDTVYGPSDSRSENYQSRQIGKNNRKTEKPLNATDQKIFFKILKRSKGERVLDYWRRQKALLNHADKHRLIRAYRRKEAKAELLMQKKNTKTVQKEIKQLEQQFQKIQSFSKSKSHHQKYKGALI